MEAQRYEVRFPSHAAKVTVDVEVRTSPPIALIRTPHETPTEQVISALLPGVWDEGWGTGLGQRLSLKQHLQ